MDAMSASVSELNRRRWLQVWNASGVIFMTVFRFRRARIACLFLSQEQVYLRFARNATIFKHLLAHFSYIVARMLRNLTKESSGERKKNE